MIDNPDTSWICKGCQFVVHFPLVVETHTHLFKHVKQSGQPPYPDSIPVQPDTHTSTSVSQDVVENDPDTSQRPPTTTIAGPSYDDLLRRDLPPQQLDPGTGEETQPPSTVRGDSLSSRRAEKQKKEAEREKTLDNLNVFRRPPTTPSLLPAYRYCYSDKLVKPYRAHHCRACGTVSFWPCFYRVQLTSLPW